MINIDALLQQIFNGIQFGVLIALLGTGLSLLFGMLGIINFAHGSLYMLGAYLLWTCTKLMNFPGKFWLGLAISFLLMAIVGLIIERGFFRRMYNQPVAYQVLLTFGILLLIQQGVALVYGTTPLQMGVPPLLEGEINLGLFFYPFYRFATMILGLIIIFSVWFLIERSHLGAIIRACAEDPETARTLGINTVSVYSWTFALGSALAGLGGCLHGPMLGSLTYPMGMEIIIILFIVVVVGGMGSIRGALLGGIILGVVRGVAGVLWAPAADISMFVSMGIILMIRPQGIWGR